MKDFFPRPDVQQRIDALLKRHNGQYDVIVGPRGTGKTTVVRKMAAETSGVVYVYIHDAGGKTVLKLEKELRSALGWWSKKKSSFEALAGLMGVNFGRWP
jgi:ABC-type cobalamin/Fe3+-siderophores transport system ATPase subunit